MPKIKEFIKRAEKLYDSNATDPAFKAWRSDVNKFLKKIFGGTSNEVTAFENIEYYNYYLTYDVFNGGWRENILKEKDLFKKGIKTAIFYLENYESEIIDLEERAQRIEDQIDIENESTEKTSNKSSKGITNKKRRNKNIFIVQGRNDGVKKQVANFLLKTVIKPIILNVDDHGIKMSSDSKDIYFEIDNEGQWQLDIAKKLKAMKLDMKKKNVRK